MLEAPENWTDYWQDPNATLELYVTVNAGVSNPVEVVYRNSDLMECTLEGAIAQNFSLGNVTSSRLMFTIKSPDEPIDMFVDGMKVTFEVAYTLDGDTTERVPQGTFYIEGVEVVNDEDFRVSAYDSLNYLKSVALDALDTAETFASYLGRLCASSPGYGISYETLVNTSISYGGISGMTVGQLPVPPAATGIEAGKVLSTIATIAGGNLYLNKSGELLLFKQNSYGGRANPAYVDKNRVLRAESASFTNEAKMTVGVYVNEMASGYGPVAAGSIDRAFYSTQADLNTLLLAADINMFNDSYNNMHRADVDISGAYISPLVELGDDVYLDTGAPSLSRFSAEEYRLTYDGGCWGFIGMNFGKDDVKTLVKESEYGRAYLGAYGAVSADDQTENPTLAVVSSHVFSLRIGLHYSAYNPPFIKPRLFRVRGYLEDVTCAMTYMPMDGGSRVTSEIHGVRMNEYSYVDGQDTDRNGFATFLFYSEDELPTPKYGETRNDIILREYDSAKDGTPFKAEVVGRKGGACVPTGNAQEPDWSYPLPVENGGTGASSLSGAWTAMGGGDIGQKDTLLASDIPDLPASKITSGTFDADRLPVVPISKGGTGKTTAAQAWTALGGGDIGKKDTLAIGDIPELPASKITSGTFDVGRIPSLAASKITSGEFDAGRIPGLPASKITSGTFAADRIPTATTSANGAITAAEKKKLNAISIGTQSNFQQNADTNGKRWRLRLSNADPANLAADVSTDGGNTWSSSTDGGSVYFAKTGHAHSASDITSGTLSTARGGTGNTKFRSAFEASNESCLASTSVAASAQKTGTTSITKSGYYPLAIYGWNCSQYGYVSRCYLSDKADGSGTINWAVVNPFSASHSISLNVFVVWAKA